MPHLRLPPIVAVVAAALVAVTALAETQREPVSRREILLRAAQNQTAARRFDKAIPYYREYLQTWPEDANVATEFGGVLIQAGQLEEAIQVLDSAIQERPDLIEAYRLLADAATMRRDWPKAVSTLESALARVPQGTDLRHKLAQVFGWSGRYEDAIRQYRILLLDAPEERPFWAGLLQVLYWAGMHDEYIAESESFLRKYAEDLPVRMTRVDLYSGRKDFAAAAQECREILKLDPNHRLARARLAQFLAWIGRWEEARDEYGRALALSPDDTGLRREYGELLLWTGHYDQARDAFRRLLTELPGDEGVIRDYLETLSHLKPLDAEDRQWVVNYFERMFKGGKSLRPSTLAALGRALKAAGKGAEALDVFEIAIQANPEDMRLRLEYADLLSALGRVDEAETQYDILLREAGKINPGRKGTETGP